MLPLNDRQVVEVLLAALAVAVGLSCEVYDRIAGQTAGDDEADVHRVNADVIVVEEPEEMEGSA